jgi:hypothetical protein
LAPFCTALKLTFSHLVSPTLLNKLKDDALRSDYTYILLGAFSRALLYPCYKSDIDVGQETHLKAIVKSTRLS